MSLTFKMTVKIFLHKIFIPIKLSTLRFVAIPPRSKAVCSLSSVLLLHILQVAMYTRQLSLRLNILILKVSSVTVVKCVSLRNTSHTSQRFYRIYKILLSIQLGTI